MLGSMSNCYSKKRTIMGKFVISKSRLNNQYYFNLKASNGESILSSEGYTTNQSCRVGIQSVISNSPYDSRYDKRIASNGNYYFNLLATNGQVIGKSEMYSSSQARDGGIASVKVNAPNASIEDNS